MFLDVPYRYTWTQTMPERSMINRSAESKKLKPPAPAGPWNFHQRLDKGTGVITREITSAPWTTKTRAHFDRAIDQLRHLPVQSWSKPNPASNIGDHTYVIRFKGNSSSQQRVFGHFHPDHRSFVMTFDGYEKDYVYYPKNYQKLAQQHRDYCGSSFTIRTQAFETLCGICPG